MRKIAKLLAGILLVVSTLPMAAAQDGHPPPTRVEIEERGAPGPSLAGRHAPDGGPGVQAASWSDTFADDREIGAVDNTVAVDGDVILTQIVPLPQPAEGYDIASMAVGQDGKLYLGTSGAYLNVYDPATGSMTSLGAPVPDECFT